MKLTCLKANLLFLKIKNQPLWISKLKMIKKKKIERLTKDLGNFVQGRDNLDKLLSQQRCGFKKAGLGYEEKKQNKYNKKLFDKSKDKGKENIQENHQCMQSKRKIRSLRQKPNQVCYNCRKK